MRGAVREDTELEQWVRAAICFDDDEDWYEGRIEAQEFPRFEASSMRRALETLAPDSLAAFSREERRTPVVRTPVAVDPNQVELCATIGTHAIVHDGESRVVVWLGWDPTNVTLYAVADDESARRRVMDRVIALATGSISAWRGQVIMFDPTELDGFRHLDEPEAGAVHLADELAAELRRNLVVPIRRYDDARSLVSSRGVLLFGRPGTGKSWATRWVQSEISGCATVVVATPAMFASPELMIALFELAGASTPTLLVMEDLDVTIRSRFEAGSGALGELLARLDGPGRVPGVFTVATTNYIAVLDEALSERPGRFDRKVEVGDATAEARRAALGRLVADLGLPEDERDPVVSAAVGRTEGWTLAELTELGQIALLDALDRDVPIDLVGSIDLVERPAGAEPEAVVGYV